ncbi:uncharacterized protein LOC126378224 [Pectinophora gossypiella]|uniref:uncharacterized protein LOC126378224 n=1 Tax=Pectinophora gossypiella TaxID=13191 RepID=UPI00214E0BA4|nr:uncharacterized protein LOC126378224 [Pectinophora gossypiella]
MEAVSKARERFAKYPVVFAKCSKQAAVYAKCVLFNEEVKKDDCAKEFKEFSACLQSAARDMKTKL